MHLGGLNLTSLPNLQHPGHVPYISCIFSINLVCTYILNKKSSSWVSHKNALHSVFFESLHIFYNFINLSHIVIWLDLGTNLAVAQPTENFTFAVSHKYTRFTRVVSTFELIWDHHCILLGTNFVESLCLKIKHNRVATWLPILKLLKFGFN